MLSSISTATFEWRGQKQHENINPSCLVSTIQAFGGTLCTHLLMTASSRMDSSKAAAFRTLLNRCHEELRHTTREQRGLANPMLLTKFSNLVMIYF